MKKILLLLSLMVPFSVQAETLPHWKVESGKSTITWAVQYSGKPVTGTLPVFSSDIVFDPEHLEQSHVQVQIKTADVSTSDKDALSNLPDSDWFASTTYPAAMFKCDHFRHAGGNRYIADGELTLRGKPVSLSLPFSLTISGHHAVMDGKTTLQRLDFGVGQGEWAKTDVVANAVAISVHVEAQD